MTQSPASVTLLVSTDGRTKIFFWWACQFSCDEETGDLTFQPIGMADLPVLRLAGSAIIFEKSL